MRSKLFALTVLVSMMLAACTAPPLPTATVPAPTNTLPPSSTPTPVPPTPTPVPPTPTPTLGIGSTLLSEKDGMTLVYVPAGEFLMGSTDADTDAGSEEKPQHKVYLDAYWIDQTEVTQGMYAKCVAAGNCKQRACTDLAIYPSGDNYPAICATWNDAQAYCEWAGRRLPTEAEWEKAARGTDGRKYPWGNEPAAGTLLNLADKSGTGINSDKTIDDGHADIAPVGTYPAGASPYGALDMAGNAWEWVADWYGRFYYDTSPDRNPTGPASAQMRGQRGGSCYFQAARARTAARGGDVPDITYGDTGFRCSR